MLGCNESPDHQYRLQHINRHNDHSHSIANLFTIPAFSQEEVCPLFRFRIGLVHGMFTRFDVSGTSYVLLTISRQILCAILNKFYSFTQPFGLDWTAWYVRESSTALITANLPMTWTLFRRLFNVGSFAGYSKDRYGTRSTSNFRSLGDRSGLRSTIRRGTTREADPADSQEEISRQYGVPLRIYQKNEVEVRSMPVGTTHERDSSSISLPEGVVTTVLGGYQAGEGAGEGPGDGASERSTTGIIKST
jgi:hypothetical protein